LAGLDHAEPACLALERGGIAQLAAPLAQALVLGLQRGDLGALLLGFVIRRDPRGRRPDVEVDDEREDRDQGPAAQTVPADPGTALHARRLRSTPGEPFLCNATPSSAPSGAEVRT